MDLEFWKGKTVFLTGHTGFKGGWLSLWLRRLGANVIGYSLLPPTQVNLFDCAAVADGMNSIIGDVRDGSQLSRAVADCRPDIVFHLAAQPLVRDSYRLPVDTYTTNVIGTVNLLEAVRICPSVKAVVIVTTDKCYENREWVWGYRENEALGGFDPYSSSKACAELVTSAYRRSFFSDGSGVALASARAGNVIGGGDWSSDRLVPDCILALQAGKLVPIRNPRAIRPWQHVLEPLSGYLSLARRLYEEGAAFADAWNFGPSDEDARSVEWVVQRICALWGDGARYEIDKGTHPHEATYLKLDCSKARTCLGWRPRLNLETALSWSVEWYRALRDGGNARSLVDDQIHRYEGLTE